MQRASVDYVVHDMMIPPIVERNRREILRVPLSWEPLIALELQNKSFQPPFGFVMRDLARRVLSRHVANSNVVVIAPDAKEASLMAIPDSLDSTDFVSPLTLGGTFVLHAAAEGHRMHTMNAGLQKNGSWTAWKTSLDHWWSSFGQEGAERRPNWILLAVVDPGFGWEDLVWSESQRFLQESTITYVVTAVRSLMFSDGTLDMSGVHAAQALLARGYKLQVLQVSHYHDDIPEKPTSTSAVFQKFGPNGLLKTVDDIEALLQWGAKSARRYSNTGAGEAPVFTAYLFGTQGLDLAIPSRREYIPDSSRITGAESWTQVNLYEPVAFKSCPKAAKRN